MIWRWLPGIQRSHHRNPRHHGIAAVLGDQHQHLGGGLPFRRVLLGLGQPNWRFEVVLPACQLIFHVIGDLLTDRSQLKHLILDGRIIGLLGKLLVHGRLVPEIVSPIHAAQSVERGVDKYKHEIGDGSCQKSKPRSRRGPRPHNRPDGSWSKY